MGGDAVEVTVRFGGNLIAVTRLAPGERFTIGTAPGVDLAVAGPTTFPLVDGFVVRLPVGVRASRAGGELAPGERIEVTLGLVTIEVVRDVEAVATLPPPPRTTRLVPFAVATLVAHVALVAVATWWAEPDPITIPVVRAEQPQRVLPETLPVKRPPTSPEDRARRARARATATTSVGGATPEASVAEARAQGRASAGFLGGLTPDRLAALLGSADLAKELADVGPLYDEAAAAASGFGGAAGAFDPTNDPSFDSVKTGRYATTGGGQRAGDGYRLPTRGKFREVERPPIIGLTCDDVSCITSGSLDRSLVRDHVEKQYVEMVKCFERHARSATRIELTLQFDIGEDGRPVEVSANGAAGFASCIVRLVERTQFPAARPTRVAAYPIAFWRTS
ncbi:MAG TPA: hypothetical protein VK427_23310 [Kofleriaceae bacterium]|nr:hypothetical protein [Kofleriaceae bacterium]